MKLTESQISIASYWAVLEQKRYWRTGNGQVIRRRSMNIQYKLNALAYIIREADRIVGTYTSLGSFRSAPDDVWAELDRMLENPERAVMETPMAQALLKDIMEYAKVTPEMLGLTRSPLVYNGTTTVWLEKP